MSGLHLLQLDILFGKVPGKAIRGQNGNHALSNQAAFPRADGNGNQPENHFRKIIINLIIINFEDFLFIQHKCLIITIPLKVQLLFKISN